MATAKDTKPAEAKKAETPATKPAEVKPTKQAKDTEPVVAAKTTKPVSVPPPQLVRRTLTCPLCPTEMRRSRGGELYCPNEANH